MTAVVVPSLQAPIVDENGNVTRAWLRFFSQLTAAPQPAQAPTVGASPWAFTAPGRGAVNVSGGTVSAISITRGRLTIPLGVTAGLFPAAMGDVFTVTFTVAPAVTFLPG